MSERLERCKLKCLCGGEVTKYADSLGTCNRCKHEFYIRYYPTKDKKMKHSLEMLRDHRRDLT
jgi:hypothetical protein